MIAKRIFFFFTLPIFLFVVELSAQPVMKFKTEGLGTSPLSEIMKGSVYINNDVVTNKQIEKFLAANKHGDFYQRAEAEKLGFVCADEKSMLCTYSGAFEYEIFVGPGEKGKVQLELSVDFSLNPPLIHLKKTSTK